MNANDIINDRYLLVRSIGRGSFGEVWLATDQKLGLNVAIKIYISLDTRGLDEFKNEFKSVYNLHHPNLLRSDYFDNVGGSPYLVMPYCPSSVGDKVGKMSEAEIWKFIKDVANGLAYLHDNDIIHRDIKPDNILIDEQGNYVITDFGLSTKMRSTLRKASARQNKTTDQSGTIGYMAPEMFSAKPNAVKATDIWALGATIYEVTTGEMPFCGQGGVMELHGAELPELPSDFSNKLGELMNKCLSKDTWDRPTAQDIINLTEEKSDKDDNDDFVSKETYDYEINSLKKILDNERANHQRAIESLQQQDKSATTSKKTKVWAWIATLSTIILIFICVSTNNSVNYWQSEYYSSQNELQSKKSQLSSVSSSLDNVKGVLETLMKNTPVMATDIQVRNSGEGYGSSIYSRNTTYINPKVTLISNKDLENQSIDVKFYTPYGLSTGEGWSSGGYSYRDKGNSISKYEPKTIELTGWGGDKKGHWSSGNYRIEIWVNGKLAGTKHFKIL